MANIILQHEGATYRTLGYTGRVTSPSLILEGDGQTLFTPLFAVASGEEGRVGNFYYRCCPLAVQDGGTTYRAAYARRYADSFSRTISTTITHSGATGSTTQTVQQDKTVTKTGTEAFNNITVPSGGMVVERNITVNYGVTFTGTPVIDFNRLHSGGIDGTNWAVVSANTTSCTIRLTAIFFFEDISSSGEPDTSSGSVDWSVSVSGKVSVSQTITTYPDETKSATASGDFNYGHTYSSAPSLSANNGVSVYNNGDNASFHASKTLSGTVSYGNSKTLTQAFNVSFTGAA